MKLKNKASKTKNSISLFDGTPRQFRRERSEYLFTDDSFVSRPVLILENRRKHLAFSFCDFKSKLLFLKIFPPDFFVYWLLSASFPTPEQTRIKILKNVIRFQTKVSPRKWEFIWSDLICGADKT